MNILKQTTYGPSFLVIPWIFNLLIINVKFWVFISCLVAIKVFDDNSNYRIKVLISLSLSFATKITTFKNFSISAHWQMYQCIVLCQFLWDGKRWVSCTQYNILNDRIGDVLTNDRCLQESPPSHDYHHWFVSCQMSVLIHACPNLLCTSSKQLWCCTLQYFKIYFRNYKFKKSWSMR